MSATPEYPPLSPSLIVNDGAAALEFYQKAFGAKELYRLVDPESGKIGHAESTINGVLVIDRAVKAGAIVVKALTEQFYGHLAGRVRDPFGHEWIISQELEKIEPEEMQRRWDAMVKAAK